MVNPKEVSDERGTWNVTQISVFHVMLLMIITFQTDGSHYIEASLNFAHNFALYAIKYETSSFYS